jgi:hypothetical protein
VEELKCNEKWTNCAADLLPLALSNWSRKIIKILSSLTQKPVFDITPTLCEPDQSSSICLAYLSSEDNSIPSHSIVSLFEKYILFQTFAMFS